ncbi:unnamed protein product, partial [Musa acuminata var. zebrina]
MEDTRNDEMYSEFIVNIHGGWGGVVLKQKSYCQRSLKCCTIGECCLIDCKICHLLEMHMEILAVDCNRE